MKLQTIVVDDEKLSREILKNFLTKYCSNITIVAEAKNISEALQLVSSHKIDLVFLDVEMPYGNAFDFIDQLVNPSFEIIFVTAYEHYAIEALNNHAAYYLTKPISIDNLIKAVNYVTQIKESEHNLENKVLVPNTSFIQDKISLPVQNGYELLEISKMNYLKADDNYSRLFLIDKTEKLVSKTLKYFEDVLKTKGFVRIHKSYLVNLNTIVSYNRSSGGTVVLKNEIELPVSTTKKAELLAFFK